MSPVSQATFWAFAAIYILWGSTYLAIRIAVHDLPPFFLGGTRFLIAGGLLVGWARLRGDAWPSRATWRSAALLGAMFFLLGNGLVIWAEQRVPSGRTALLASTSPIWTVLIESGLAGWSLPSAPVLVGVGLGFGGLALLSNPSEALAATVPISGVLALVGAGLAWAAGSVYSHRRPVPGSPAMATGITMLAGGLQFALLSLLFGEWRTVHADGIPWSAWAAVAYLVVFGSIIGFTAFTYLLRTSTPQRVATSAYVNPLVALALGWGLAGEDVTARMLAGGAVILASVVLIRWPARPPSTVEVGAVESGEWPVQ